jgi:LmbE family N-acetylglucosaminyl deacetylase
MTRKENVLAICAHPDDETLGLGGTLARHVESGDNVSVLIFADGQFKRDNTASGIKKRQNQAKKACSIIGVKKIEFLNFTDQKLDTVPLVEIINKIEIAIKKSHTGILYVHHWGDVNQDHRRLFEASLVACRPYSSSTVKQLICFETPSSTGWGSSQNNFIPNLFVDIEKTIDKKIKALREYKEEIGRFPHPRSIEAIENRSKFWGSTVGIKNAEAFHIVRQIL